jgi:hypothetical protein
MAGSPTVLQISKAQSGDVLHDGDGLIFEANGGGRRRWVYRFMLRGKRRDMGLGSVSHLTRRNGKVRGPGINGEPRSRPK